MTPYEYRIIIDKSREEALTNYFLTVGAVAMTVRELDHDDQKIQLIVLFNDEALLPTMNAVLPVLKAQELIHDHQFHQHDDSIDWVAETQKEFPPVLIGDRLCICSKDQIAFDRDRITVVLDPGAAFGTGTHPTTHLCLQWLEKNIQGGERIIDYGCGTGVLAISAIKLGAKQVIAVDIEDQAIAATAANATLNAISADQLSVVKSLDESTQSVDLIICNIIINPLITFSNQFSRLLKPAGMLVLSGMLVNQIDDVLHAYLTQFELLSIEQQDEWARLVMRRHDA